MISIKIQEKTRREFIKLKCVVLQETGKQAYIESLPKSLALLEVRMNTFFYVLLVHTHTPV